MPLLAVISAYTDSPANTTTTTATTATTTAFLSFSLRRTVLLWFIFGKLNSTTILSKLELGPEFISLIFAHNVRKLDLNGVRPRTHPL